MPEAPPLLPGMTLDGRYRLDRPLEGCGLGETFRATDLQARERAVCVKVLGTILGDSVWRFEAHAEALRKLQHPHVVPVTASGLTAGRAYLVMDVSDGGSLAARIARHRAGGGARPSPEAAWRTFDPVCLGVGAAHAGVGEGHMVHGALGPASVRVGRGETDDGDASEVRVLDFGLWPFVGTGTGGGLVPWEYIAPEQEGSPILSPATDVFALGVLLLDLLAARPADGPDEARAWWHGLRSPGADVPGILARIRPDVHPSVWDALAPALCRLPEQRYATAAILRDALCGVSWVASAALRVPVPLPSLPPPVQQPPVAHAAHQVDEDDDDEDDDATAAMSSALIAQQHAELSAVVPAASVPQADPDDDETGLFTDSLLARNDGEHTMVLDDGEVVPVADTALPDALIARVPAAPQQAAPARAIPAVGPLGRTPVAPGLSPGSAWDPQYISRPADAPWPAPAVVQQAPRPVLRAMPRPAQPAIVPVPRPARSRRVAVVIALVALVLLVALVALALLVGAPSETHRATEGYRRRSITATAATTRTTSTAPSTIFTPGDGGPSAPSRGATGSGTDRSIPTGGADGALGGGNTWGGGTGGPTVTAALAKGGATGGPGRSGRATGVGPTIVAASPIAMREGGGGGVRTGVGAIIVAATPTDARI